MIADASGAAVENVLKGMVGKRQAPSKTNNPFTEMNAFGKETANPNVQKHKKRDEK